MPPLIEGGRSAMDRAASAGTGAAEGVAVALAAPLAAEPALAGPDERGGVGIPAARGRFEPVDDVLGGGGCLSDEGAAHEDPLDGLGHVQPGTTQRGVER